MIHDWKLCSGGIASAYDKRGFSIPAHALLQRDRGLGCTAINVQPRSNPVHGGVMRSSKLADSSQSLRKFAVFGHNPWMQEPYASSMRSRIRQSRWASTTFTCHARAQGNSRQRPLVRRGFVEFRTWGWSSKLDSPDRALLKTTGARCDGPPP